VTGRLQWLMPTRPLALAAASLVLAAILGCPPDVPLETNDDDVADGIRVERITINQGVQRTLVEDGAPATSSVPLVEGRPGLLRVFAAGEGAVVARLTFEGGDELSVETALSASPAEADLASTINFELPGDRVAGTLRFRVELFLDGSDEAAAVYPPEGLAEVPTDVAENVLRVRIVPYRYDADGSGRLPDTSQAALDAYRDRLLGLYPVTDVEVTVGDPRPIETAVGPDGSGWQEVGQDLYFHREAQEGAGGSVYYYGVFQPTETSAEFCAGGCLAGVTLLNAVPEDVGSPSLRMALGLGFPGVSPTGQDRTDIAAHELGHAHGVAHVDCGPGVDPGSVDETYPHDGDTIGTWGWDIVSEELIDPDEHTDVMGYCPDQWISDHNYTKLAFRGRNVNEPRDAE